jgi:putative membrane protein
MSTSNFDATKIKRPDRSLLTYYIVVSLLTGPGAPLAFIPFWLRYLTLEYKFDDEGVSMCWGVIFRREIYLTYRRLQDIHLTRNVIERWLGLSKISLQTASGNAGAEMTIEGVLEAEPLRDFLYSKMRGSKDRNGAEARVTASGSMQHRQEELIAASSTDARATQTLIEIRDALKSLVDKKDQ